VRPSPDARRNPPLVAELSIRVAGGPDAPGEARAALRRFNPELPPELMQIVVLLASELVANAVQHAGSDWIPIRCEVLPAVVRVEVFDDGNGFTPDPVRPVRGLVGGWGLHLVDELSSRWGVAGGGGTRVWFEVDR
jgi:anti-sigma regulatory factor (Ser/Thr protein kinase)